MHRILHALEETFPCNAYCRENVHVDIDYAHPGRPGSPAHQITLCWRLHPEVTILAVREAPEAQPARERYPYNIRRLAAMGLDPDDWIPVRVTYRIGAQITPPTRAT